MTITLGWWMLPTVLTIALFGLALSRPVEPTGAWGIPDIMPLFRVAAATILSLIAWVAYLATRLALA